MQATVPVSNELWEDAGDGLSSYLRRAVAERLDFAVTNHLLNGDGVGKPLGVLNLPAIITQTKEGAQAAGTVIHTNISKRPLLGLAFKPCLPDSKPSNPLGFGGFLLEAPGDRRPRVTAQVTDFRPGIPARAP